MNRGVLFYMPTAQEWTDYNRTVLNRAEFTTHSPDGGTENSPSGVYLLASYMPAITLSLTQPDLVWCVDASTLSRHETRINIGSSYYVMEKCILGPLVHYSEASIDKRVTMFVENFANEVSNGLRWILQIYRSTNILQQHELFDMELSIAENIRNKLAFESYTPVQLVADLSDTSRCKEVQVHTTADKPFYRQQFGYTSGVAAPVGGLGQMSRPHLGSSPIVGFRTPAAEELAVRDPYVLRADDVRQLNELIAKNREVSVYSNNTGIFRPTSGMGSVVVSGPLTNVVGRPSDGVAAAAATATSFGGDGNASTSYGHQLQIPIPEPPPPPPGVNAEDVTMEDVDSDLELVKRFLNPI